MNLLFIEKVYIRQDLLRDVCERVQATPQMLIEEKDSTDW